MYQLIGREGDDYCLIDHEKLLIFPATEEDLWKLIVEEGVEIRGLSNEDVDFRSRKCVLASSECNWVRGENIFKKARRMWVNDDDKFTIVSGERSFSGVVNRSDAKVFVLEFIFGVQVPIWHEDFEALMSGESDKVLAALKVLYTESPDDEGLEDAYYEALSSGNDEQIDSAIKALVYCGCWPI